MCLISFDLKMQMQKRKEEIERKEEKKRRKEKDLTLTTEFQVSKELLIDKHRTLNSEDSILITNVFITHNHNIHINNEESEHQSV